MPPGKWPIDHTTIRRGVAVVGSTTIDFNIGRQGGPHSLGPLHPGDIDAQVFARLADARSLIALDVQGLLRKFSTGRVAAAVSEHLTAARIVKSDEDLIALTMD